ncbi:hypothetical protein B7P43_G14846, partial [Cryptotermes secundus]
RKRKIDDECRAFNEEWGVKYFFIQSNSKANAVCLICKDTVAVLKEYNIRRHYDTKHASTFSQFKEKQRSDKLESLRRCLRSQQDLFTKANLLSSCLPVVLYGCETWSLTLREEHRVLRRIFGLKRDEVTGGWRKLHNEELHNLYSSPSIIRMIESRRMRWVGHVARMGETSNVCKILVVKPEGGRPQGRPRRRWADNIRVDLIGWDGMDWIDLTQDKDQWRALVNTVMTVTNLRVP